MSALTDYARGKDCEIRVPGVCNFNPETTVACHVPLMGNHGTGFKPMDLHIAFGCSDCHDAVDRRRFLELDRDFVRQCHVEGMMRTQAKIMREAPHLIANYAKKAA
jgi:hypothetical protein